MGFPWARVPRWIHVNPNMSMINFSRNYFILHMWMTIADINMHPLDHWHPVAPPFHPLHLLPVARGRSCTNLNWRWSSDWWGTNWSSRTGPLEPNPLFCRCRKKVFVWIQQGAQSSIEGNIYIFLGGGHQWKVRWLNLRLMWDEIFSLRQMLSDFKDQLLFWFGLEV